jgi:hypothetical protein
MSLIDQHVQLQNLTSLFHEGHHFILMAMEVHDTLEPNMDCFMRECAHLFHDQQSRGHLSLSFYIQFLSNMLVLFFNMF